VVAPPSIAFASQAKGMAWQSHDALHKIATLRLKAELAKAIDGKGEVF